MSKNSCDQATLNRMDPPKDQKVIMIIAGEASGDLHASKLVRALRNRDHTLFFLGIGGEALKNEGVRIFFDASRLAVVGITEALAKIPRIFKGMALAKLHLKTLKPDLLILLDFPDFNLSVAAAAKKLGVPVLYYISPQLWAWRPGRIKKIKNRVDHVAVILPFERDYFKNHQIPATFVGHPLLDSNPPPMDMKCEKKTQKDPIIGLLPGSRDKEIKRLLPVMLDAAQILRTRKKNVRFIVSTAHTVKRTLVEAIIKKHNQSDDFEIIADRVGKILERSKLVIATSGTVTLEAAIFGIPGVIIYKVSPISYWLGKMLIKVKYIGLVNLIAGREVIPELIQEKATPGNIAETVEKMLTDMTAFEQLKKELFAVREGLGGPGASERVADLALDMLRSGVLSENRKR